MAKRRKIDSVIGDASLADLLHRGGVSSAGLASILARIGGSTASESTNRSHLKAANKSEFTRIAHRITLQTVDGGDLHWPILDPSLLLQRLLEESVGLQELYQCALSRCPPSPSNPWRLIVAFDEYIPGNKLSTDQSRKTMVLSFTFAELGQSALSRGMAWCTAVCVRSKLIETVVMSQTSVQQGRW